MRLLAAALGVLLLQSHGAGLESAAQTAAAPRVFLLDAVRLQENGARLESKDPEIAAAWAALKRDADKALAAGPFTVTSKAVDPPSGDRHDYLSQAPYWWPDPAKPKGLPYIRRDGERNPELNRITDHQTMDRMRSGVETLALAAYLGGDERYADKAIQLLRAWFIDSATRMTPHLEYAQFIPGVNTGRGIGLIETRELTRVVDAIGLLETTRAWRPADGTALRQWFGSFLTWMQESRNGRDEAAARNNHGTYYDLQVASYALFVDRRDVARDVMQAARMKRIAAQIEPDGSQPLELERTQSWSYSVMNLRGLIDLATLAQAVDVDLWSYRTPDGRSIRAALLYLAPYALGDKKWPHQQITGWTPEELLPLLRRAAAHYTDPEFTRISTRVPPDTARSSLLR